ncbi:MAG: ABC transporter ATP-binding protein [Lachnospiraceae bacterium]|nr:ABC transporter ATP-binding protein [Lachnospiraceae bacterium]
MFIDLINAKKIYGKGESEVRALDGASLQLDEGGVYVILGPSGSGKSTLLNMLGGLDSLDEGELSIGGVKLSGEKNKLVEYRRSDVGFVFQFYNLIPDLTVKENIQVVADIAESPLDIDEVMEAVDIMKYQDHFPSELSGGQQQRVSIARAIIKNPKLLLCDELTGALDSKSAKQVLKFIERVNQTFHTTIIIITHNEAIAHMADRIIRIKDGQVSSNVENTEKVAAAELEL